MEHYGLGTILSKVITKQFVTKPKNGFEIACFVQRLLQCKVRAATVVGIPTNGRYTDHFQDSVYLPRCCCENNT